MKTSTRWHLILSKGLNKSLNLWMQHYMDNPEAFEHEFQTVALFLF